MVAENVSEPINSPEKKKKIKEGEDKKAPQRAPIMQLKFDLTPSCVHSVTLIFGHIGISTQSLYFCLITDILTSHVKKLRLHPKSNGKSLKGL